MRYGNVEIKNRHKYLLQYHIIFVCKYRKKLLMSKQISDDIKHLAVAALFTIRHWHIGKKYTRKRKSQLVKRIVIITVTEN